MKIQIKKYKNKEKALVLKFKWVKMYFARICLQEFEVTSLNTHTMIHNFYDIIFILFFS